MVFFVVMLDNVFYYWLIISCELKGISINVFIIFFKI